MIIREVNADQDASQILQIYAPYVLNTCITYEYTVPSLGEFKNRILKISSKHAYFVAEVNGIIVGYAYATQFRERTAYDWTLESAIYVQETHHAKREDQASIASLLYEALFQKLKAKGIKQVIGVISLPNDKSVRFHEKMGFEKIGIFQSVGFKHDQWHDALFMTKFLEARPLTAPK